MKGACTVGVPRMCDRLLLAGHRAGAGQRHLQRLDRLQPARRIVVVGAHLLGAINLVAKYGNELFAHGPLEIARRCQWLVEPARPDNAAIAAFLQYVPDPQRAAYLDRLREAGILTRSVEEDLAQPTPANQ